MPSEAGEAPYYMVETEDGWTKLPRVTHILKRVIAKPELMGWYYKYTRDAISGMVAVLLSEYGDSVDDVLRMLTDADWLEEYMKENRLRPEDYAKERAVEGGDRHDFFERLGRQSLESSGSDLTLAEWGSRQADPVTRGLSEWWLEERPDVLAAETKLTSVAGGYAGTVDQIARRARFDNEVVITDLKTRRANTPCGVAHKTEEAARKCHEVWPYKSDHIQTAPYMLMWNDTPYSDLWATRRTVLIARADGSVVEEESAIDASIWHDIMSVWNKMGEEV